MNTPGPFTSTSPRSPILTSMPGHGAADRVGIGLGVGLAGDQRRRLGGAVDLLEVDAERAEEAEGVGPERRAAGVAPARVAQAELVAHRAVDEELAQRVGRAASASDSGLPSVRLAARSARPAPRKYSKTRRLSGEASPPLTCIGRQHVLPDARRRQHGVGAELAQVALHRLRALRAVGGSSPPPAPMPSVKAASPTQRHRQVRTASCRPRLTSFDLDEGLGRRDHVAWLSIAPLGLPVVPEV